MHAKSTPNVMRIASLVGKTALESVVSQIEGTVLEIEDLAAAIEGLIEEIPGGTGLPPYMSQSVRSSITIAGMVRKKAELAGELCADAQILAADEMAAHAPSTQHADRASEVPSYPLLFECSRDDMCDFSNALIDYVDRLKLFKVALSGSEPFDMYGAGVFLSNMDLLLIDIERLSGRMQRCIEPLSGAA